MVYIDIVLIKDIKKLVTMYLKKNLVIDFFNIIPLYYIVPELKALKLIKMLRLGMYFSRIHSLVTETCKKRVGLKNESLRILDKCMKFLFLLCLTVHIFA